MLTDSQDILHFRLIMVYMGKWSLSARLSFSILILVFFPQIIWTFSSLVSQSVACNDHVNFSFFRVQVLYPLRNHFLLLASN